MSEQNNEMVTVTGLWLNKDKNGNQYFKGSMGMANILIFKNPNKKSDSSPDYFFKLAPKPPKKDEDENQDPDNLPF